MGLASCARQPMPPCGRVRQPGEPFQVAVGEMRLARTSVGNRCSHDGPRLGHRARPPALHAAAFSVHLRAETLCPHATGRGRFTGGHRQLRRRGAPVPLCARAAAAHSALLRLNTCADHRAIGLAFGSQFPWSHWDPRFIHGRRPPVSLLTIRPRLAPIRVSAAAPKALFARRASAAQPSAPHTVRLPVSRTCCRPSKSGRVVSRGPVTIVVAEPWHTRGDDARRTAGCSGPAPRLAERAEAPHRAPRRQPGQGAPPPTQTSAESGRKQSLLSASRRSMFRVPSTSFRCDRFPDIRFLRHARVSSKGSFLRSRCVGDGLHSGDLFEEARGALS